MRLFLISNLFAVPACPNPITISQSDGSVIKVILGGDEYFHYQTTLDGYPLIPCVNSILCYAQQDETGNLVSSNVKANEVYLRSPAELLFIQGLTPNIDLSSKYKINRVVRSKAGANISSPSTQNFPLIGSPNSLVILVDFSDLKFVTPNPNNSFYNLLNQSGYSSN